MALHGTALLAVAAGALVGLDVGFVVSAASGAAGLPADFASWVQSGGVIGLLLWSLLESKKDRKADQERYEQLLGKAQARYEALLRDHESLHAKTAETADRAAAAMRVAATAMAKQTQAILDMKSEVRLCKVARGGLEPEGGHS